MADHPHDHSHPHTHGPDDPEVAPRSRPTLPRGAGEGKLLFLDTPSGVAGDMLVAALVDLGVPEETVLDAAAALGLDGARPRFFGGVRSGIVARRFEVDVTTPQPSRDYATIRALLERVSGLTDGARAIALDAFARLAAAEADVHGTTVDAVHFHEVGAVDSIIDVVGVAAALDHLGADVVCSPLPMGRGLVATQHGPLPSPAPATLLCLRDVPTYDAGIDAELVTPTGACLVASVAREFVRWPRFAPELSGWGAGTRIFRDRPNALRAVLGRPSDSRLGLSHARHVVLELNVDDLSGEIAADALARALEAGALDTWSTPIGMKKGRPALMLSALAPRDATEQVARALLAETTSLGLRLREVDRLERPRRSIEVLTPYGAIPVKIADGDGLPANLSPEHDACRAAATKHGVPVKLVMAAALAAALTSARSGND